MTEDSRSPLMSDMEELSTSHPLQKKMNTTTAATITSSSPLTISSTDVQQQFQRTQLMKFREKIVHIRREHNLDENLVLSIAATTTEEGLLSSPSSGSTAPPVVWQLASPVLAPTDLVSVDYRPHHRSSSIANSRSVAMGQKDTSCGAKGRNLSLGDTMLGSMVTSNSFTFTPVQLQRNDFGANEETELAEKRLTEDREKSDRNAWMICGLRKILLALDEYFVETSSLLPSLANSAPTSRHTSAENSDSRRGKFFHDAESVATSNAPQRSASLQLSKRQSSRKLISNGKDHLQGSAQDLWRRSSNTSVASLALSQQLPFQETHAVVQRRDEDGNKIINDYVIIAQIGRGSQGKVKLAQHLITNKVVAIKIYNKSANKWWRAAQIASQKRLEREIQIMKDLKHRNIVQLHEVIDDPSSNKMYMVMQYIENGPVCVMGCGGRCPALPEEQVAIIVRQVVTGLRYLHRHGVVHRDVKPENILMDSSGTVYLADFGVAEVFEAEEHPLICGTIGTPLFFAPEMFCHGHHHTMTSHTSGNDTSSVVGAGTATFGSMRGGGSGEGVSGVTVDVWAMGVTAYALLFGVVPFGTNDRPLAEDVQYSPLTFPNDSVISHDARDFLQRVLEKDPAQRITLAEVRKHPWLVSAKAASRRQSSFRSQMLPSVPSSLERTVPFHPSSRRSLRDTSSPLPRGAGVVPGARDGESPQDIHVHMLCDEKASAEQLQLPSPPSSRRRKDSDTAEVRGGGGVSPSPRPRRRSSQRRSLIGNGGVEEARLVSRRHSIKSGSSLSSSVGSRTITAVGSANSLLEKLERTIAPSSPSEQELVKVFFVALAVVKWRRRTWGKSGKNSFKNHKRQHRGTFTRTDSVAEGGDPSLVSLIPVESCRSVLSEHASPVSPRTPNGSLVMPPTTSSDDWAVSPPKMAPPISASPRKELLSRYSVSLG